MWRRPITVGAKIQNRREEFMLQWRKPISKKNDQEILARYKESSGGELKISTFDAKNSTHFTQFQRISDATRNKGTTET